MVFIPTPNTVEVVVRGQVAAQNVINTLYFSNPSSFDEALLNALGSAIFVWWRDQMLPQMAAAYTLMDITVRDVSVVDGRVDVSAAPPGTVGGDAAEVMPNNVAWVVKFLTGFAGRSFRGRNYIGGLANDQVASQNVLTTYAAYVLDAYNGLLTGDADLPEGWTWVVRSLFNDHAPRAEGVATPVTVVTFTDTKVDTMRRRLKGST